MKQGSKTALSLCLYEPRLLMRTLVIHLAEEYTSFLETHQSLLSFSESVAVATSGNKVLFIGVGGAGQSLIELLRFVRKMKSSKVKTIAWVPADSPWLTRLLQAINVQHVLAEDELDMQFPGALREALGNKLPASRPCLTLTELEILLQFAGGLSSKEMAERRNCSYKTIFSWKHNICEALAIESHAQWLELLSELVQLSSLYRAR